MEARKTLTLKGKGAKGRAVQRREISGREKRMSTRRNYLATIGQGEMASASLQIIADTAIVDQKVEVEGARR